VAWLVDDRLAVVWLGEDWLGGGDPGVGGGTAALLLALVMARVKALVRFAWLLVSSS